MRRCRDWFTTLFILTFSCKKKQKTKNEATLTDTGQGPMHFRRAPSFSCPYRYSQWLCFLILFSFSFLFLVRWLFEIDYASWFQHISYSIRVNQKSILLHSDNMRTWVWRGGVWGIKGGVGKGGRERGEWCPKRV